MRHPTVGATPLSFPLEFDFGRSTAGDSVRTRVGGGKLEQRYLLRPTTKTQKRLAGRLELVPQLDLGSYRTRALVDWVRVRVDSATVIAATDLKKRLESSLGIPSSRVEGPERQWGWSGRSFAVKFDDPEPETLFAWIARIDAEPDLNCAGELESIEISLDWVPTKPRTERARALMTDLLQRHIRPADEIWRKDECWPRWTGRRGGSQQIINSRFAETPLSVLNPRMMHPGRASRLLHERPPVDATVYFGPRDPEHGDVLMRVMHKVLDQQHRAKGTARILPDEERRSRIEVELRGAALAACKLTTCVDLRKGRFQNVRPRYFRFAIATLQEEIPGGIPGVTRLQWRKRQLQHFEKGGVLALDLLQRERERIAREVRHVSRGRRAKTGEPDLRRAREWSACIDFGRLGRRCDDALQALSKRWSISPPGR